MGILIKRLEELFQSINYINKMSRSFNTPTLKSHQHNFLYNIFRTLFPLDVRNHLVCKVDHSKVDFYRTTDNPELYLGRWLKLKDEYMDFVVSEYELCLNLFHNYGDEMIPFVRKSIGEEFKECITLLRQIKPYEELLFSKRIDPPQKLFYFSHLQNLIQEPEAMDKQEILVNKILLKSSRPSEIFLLKEEDELSDGLPALIHYIPRILTLEDIWDDVLTLFDEFVGKIKPIFEYNKVIEEVMSKTVAHISLAKELSHS